MRHLKYNKLSLNGKIYQGSELIQFCNLKLEDPQSKDCEKSAFTFILDWLDEAEIISVKTSGSTGSPKQIQLKKKHMVNSAQATAKALNLKAKQTALLALSAEYIAGKMMIVRSFVIGLNLIVVEPDGDPLENLDERIDFTAFVPFQLSNILNSKTQTKKLQQIGNVLIGGGAIDESLIQKISSLKNNLYGTYGMTETCTHIALRKLNGVNPDKYYKSIGNVNISVDERSCLVIDAKNLNAKKLITNDIATLISASEFVINGRYDHIINTGGIKISPELIEAKLKDFTHTNFIITSVPDAKLGEKIILVIESKTSNLSELYALWKKLESVLIPYEIPKVIEFFIPFPFTPTGKIDRKKLQQKIEEKLIKK